MSYIHIKRESYIHVKLKNRDKQRKGGGTQIQNESERRTKQ
jgi:hypothetical protein